MLRRTGVDFVGDVPWGTHFCQFYSTADDLAEILVPYFKAGLEGDEACMWITSPPLEAREAWGLLARAVPDLQRYRALGRIEIIPHTEWYLAGGSFAKDRVLRGWREKLEAALSRGCAGLRLSGNTFWLEKSDWKSFTDYEAEVDSVVRCNPMLALCTYSLARCGATEIADVIRNHQFALLQRGEAWEVFESLERRRLAETILHRRSTTVEAINRILAEALSCATEEQLGRVVLATVQDLTGSQMGFIAELNEQGLIDTIAVSDSGWAACRLPSSSLPVSLPVRGIYSRVIKDRKALFTNDPPSHPDSIGTPEGHAPLRSFLAVPLLDGDRIFGLACQANRDGGYREEQVEALESLAPAIVQALLRKRAEVALRDSEARLTKSQEIGHLGSWELDLIRNRLTWSDEVYRIFGLMPQQFRATYEAFLEAVHPDDRAAVNEAYASSLRTRRDYEIEHRVVRARTGEVRTVHEKCQHMLDADGRIIRSIGLVLDITERKQAEQERERHLAAIEEANAAKDLFFNTLSHELRTPLAAMMNSVEVLKNPEATPPQRSRVLGILERNVRHQMHLIDDLLDLARVMRGKIVIARSRLDLCEIVTAQAEASEAAARKVGTALRVELPGQAVPVTGDAVRLGQVILNLLTNAIKFTEAGSITVRISVEGECAVVRVRDTGVGIPADLLRQIFEPFRQGDSSLARSKGGLGIGLAVARSLTELHGGTLVADSEGEGRGSEFTLRLPLLESAPCAESNTVPSDEPRRRRRVLVVEDNPDLRESLLIVLELMGHQVSSAASGREAIELARRDLPDVLLIDVGLPDMDGYQVARRLREEPTTRGLHLVALTGYATLDHRDRALLAGFDHHLAKPISATDLQCVLSRTKEQNRRQPAEVS